MWYECAYEWRIVSYAMHAHARLNAKAAGKVLYYIPAVDIPSAAMTKEDFDNMRAEPNVSTTAKFPSILALYISAEMIITEPYLPPFIVGGTPVIVEDIELHPQEPPIQGRPSIATHGCVLLKYMPKCVYVRLQNSKTSFLGAAGQPSAADMLGLFAVQPKPRSSKYKRLSDDKPVAVNRTQVPLLPMKQCTLHGVLGKTAKPGLIAHWTFPVGLSKISIWLAYYAILSRPPGLAYLFSFGLPSRDIIEGGPPEEITKVFDEFFKQKILRTKKKSVRQGPCSNGMATPTHLRINGTFLCMAMQGTRRTTPRCSSACGPAPIFLVVTSALHF